MRARDERTRDRWVDGCEGDSGHGLEALCTVYARFSPRVLPVLSGLSSPSMMDRTGVQGRSRGYQSSFQTSRRCQDRARLTRRPPSATPPLPHPPPATHRPTPTPTPCISFQPFPGRVKGIHMSRIANTAPGVNPRVYTITSRDETRSTTHTSRDSWNLLATHTGGAG